MRIRSFFRPALTVAVLCAFMLSLSGCGLTDTQAWKSSRRFYYRHVNTPAELDLSGGGSLAGDDARLVARVMAVDAQLTALERALDALPSVPDEAGVDSLLRCFPWLSGVTLINPSGYVLASVPSTPFKQLDFTPLLEVAPKTPPRVLRAAVQDTPLGPEVMVARPFLLEAELAGLLVATFDFRSLLPYVDSPDDLVVCTPDILLWSGDLFYSETPLADVDWAETLRHRSYGKASGKSGQAVWIARYLGAVPLVFATLADDED